VTPYGARPYARPLLLEPVLSSRPVSQPGSLFAGVAPGAVAETYERELWARLADRDVIDAAGAWEWLPDLPATGTCAPALGLGERALRMTPDHARKREQFGHPIATFQAVTVQAADRFIGLRAREATLWPAAWRIDSGAAGPAARHRGRGGRRDLGGRGRTPDRADRAASARRVRCRRRPA
jgi:hypothetical protein